MAEAFMGEIRLIAFSYPPRGWMFCQGQILSVSQYSALFALLGTTYGGNGQTTFALPDLRGRLPVGAGSGPGLTPINAGQMGGTETTTLGLQNMPVHNHTTTAAAGSISVGGISSNPNSVPSATNNVLAASGAGQGSATIWSDSLNDPVNVANPVNVNVTVNNTGGSQPFSTRNPYVGMNYAICIEGIFPSRN